MTGKNAPGLRGFPTPDDMAPDGGYVVFRVPKDNQWAGLILGAAQLLSYSYNFYEWGDMTPDEAAEAFRVIVDQAPYETCGCVYPNGKRILRLNGDGHVEQLTDGEWTEPTDDYTIPPVPARTEPTCEERRCLAAANCAHVLEVLYETVADAVAEGADEAEALAVLIGAAIIIIGGWLGLVLAALVTAIVGAFVSFVELASLLVSDLWTAEFTEALRCMLYRCSVCDGDVIHFDFQCVREEMANYTDILDPNFITNLRLFGQVDFILNVIGVDGLDAAGATTAIETADCSDCEVCGGEVQFAAGEPAGSVFHIFAGAFDTDHVQQTCVGGFGSTSTLNFGLLIQDGACAYVQAEADIEVFALNASWYIYGLNDPDPTTGDVVLLSSGTATPGVQTIGDPLAGTDAYYGLRVIIDTAAGCGTGDVFVNTVRAFGS